jgi:hypothetical protein
MALEPVKTAGRYNEGQRRSYSREIGAIGKEDPIHKRGVMSEWPKELDC